MADSKLIFQSITHTEGASRDTKVEVPHDEVHVWGFLLDADAETMRWARRCLSLDETERADRLVSERRRQEFILAHAALRMVLSGYCGRKPHELLLQRTRAGKPVLQSADAGLDAIRFNLTHSHGRALIAVAKSRDVGIDLEKVRTEVDVVSLARRFLSHQEQAAIERLETARRHEQFLRLWVGREAALKAEGTGVTLPLNRERVEISADGKEARLVSDERRQHPTQFIIRFLPIEAGWMGAVAAAGDAWRFRLCR